MARFGVSSMDKLLSCHPDLQRLMNALVAEMDVTILCGFRNREDQEAAFNSGASKAHFGESAHNFKPSLAVDVAPYPLDWNNLAAFDDMLNKVLELAKELGIEVRLGRDFKGLRDYPHVELAIFKNKGKT